jgi:hypothetical protein
VALIQAGYDERGMLKDNCSTLEQLYVPLYSNMMKLSFLLRLVHFCDILYQAGMTDKNFDRPKMSLIWSVTPVVKFIIHLDISCRQSLFCSKGE